jgi:hypothetical protein
MKPLIRKLTDRLVEKGIGVTSIPAFIRNVANILAAHPAASLDELNKSLELVGWGDFRLDDYILQMIIAALESGIGLKFESDLYPAYKSANSLKLGDGREHVLAVRDDHECMQE